ncbi:putative oxidoreductase YjgC [Marmoricola endophyticus]|uniref:Oxidoreductase YjgC n=1 Tax=Marmoricola endophyticus TaxID=2040280 RepID=A0A917F263_9ACTN|nr:formate dehydrogenase subunit alpha [Marmoricola endophyticus]GGF45490.1 putative oxidoreductase YjgC [Marmoricola endophyticus]
MTLSPEQDRDRRATWAPLSEDAAAPPDRHVTVRVDGRDLTAVEGRPLIEALVSRDGTPGTFPSVCYHPALGAIQTCDTCAVEIDGEVVRACATPATDGLEVGLGGASADAREQAGQRLVRKHTLYCTVCDHNDGACTLKKGVEATGLTHETIGFEPKPYEVDDSHPFYRYDPDQCILCGRCVEACQDVQVTETLSIDWGSDDPRVLWDGGVPAGESSCVSCGHCVSVCPCNALMEKSMLGKHGLMTDWPGDVRKLAIDLVKDVEPTTGYLPLYALSDAEAKARMSVNDVTKTVCTYCGVGCSFDVVTSDRDILKIQPSYDGPANSISTCVKGKFGWDHINASDRLTKPLVRDGQRFRETTWDEALDVIAERLGAIKGEHGADALGVIGSSKATNEESYLTMKLARQVIGTHNVDNCSRYCQAPATQGLWRTVGYGGDSGSISDMERASLVIMVGTNTAASHPVIASRLRRAQKLHGQQHVVADLRRHEMAQRAEIFLKPAPGTDLVWMSAMTRYILDEGLADDDFLKQRVNGLDDYRESLAAYTIEYAAERTGIDADTLRSTARTIAAAESVCALWAMGVTQHSMGSDTSTAISNLLLVTGNYGRPGTGAYPLRGHNNVQGCSDFGTINTFYTGYQPVSDEAVADKFAAAWHIDRLPLEGGLDNHGMVDAIQEGSLRGLVVIGEEISLVDANVNYVQEALTKLDFLVVSELFFSRTCEFADVVLPAAASLEKDGTFTSTERRIQRLNKAMDPIGEARADWRILQGIAERMGTEWGYTHPSDIMGEIADLTPMFAGVSYERLEGYRSLQWPVAEDGTDSPLLYEESFHFDDGKARLYPLEFREPVNQTTDEYPLHVNNGRTLEHFHEGNMTLRSEGLSRIEPDTYVEMTQRTASEQGGLRTGDWVKLISPSGEMSARILLSDEVADGEVYVPMQAGEINRLTSNDTDPDSHTPAYKETSARVERTDGPIERRGGWRRGADRARHGARDREDVPTGSPLPPHHHRYGHPTPQLGVRVDLKWEREDYVPPTETEPKGAKA